MEPSVSPWAPLYLVRHCKAAGQAPDAALTPEGEAQTRALAQSLSGHTIGRICSSPFLRAVQTAQPLASRLGLPIETDPRLAERVLSGVPLPDWYERLRATFDDPDLCLEGGESSRAAATRGLAALTELWAAPSPAVVVTHGNLMALLLRHFDSRFGFEEWNRLSNPDVYRLSRGAEGVRVERLWDVAG